MTKSRKSKSRRGGDCSKLHTGSSLDGKLIGGKLNVDTLYGGDLEWSPFESETKMVGGSKRRKGKSMKRKSMKRKSMKRKSMKRKSVKRGGFSLGEIFGGFGPAATVNAFLGTKL
jgi:hypothetical protein